MTFGLGREIFLPATPVPDNQDLIFLERKNASDEKKNSDIFEIAEKRSRRSLREISSPAWSSTATAQAPTVAGQMLV